MLSECDVRTTRARLDVSERNHAALAIRLMFILKSVMILMSALLVYMIARVDSFAST